MSLKTFTLYDGNGHIVVSSDTAKGLADKIEQHENQQKRTVHHENY